MTPFGKWAVSVLTTITLAVGGYCITAAWAHSIDIDHLKWHDTYVEEQVHELKELMADVRERVIRIEERLNERRISID